MCDHFSEDLNIGPIQTLTRIIGEIFVVAESTARVDPDLAPFSRIIATIVTQTVANVIEEGAK